MDRQTFRALVNQEIGHALEDLLPHHAQAGEVSRLVMARPLAAALVPDTVQDVVTARIDRLAEGPRRLLRLAAVVGRDFTRRLLDQVLESGASADTLLRELLPLRDRGPPA